MFQEESLEWRRSRLLLIERAGYRIVGNFKVVDGLSVIGWRSPEELVAILVGRRDDTVLRFGDDNRLLGCSALRHDVSLLTGPLAKAHLVLGRESERVHRLRLQVLQDVGNIYFCEKSTKNEKEKREKINETWGLLLCVHHWQHRPPETYIARREHISVCLSVNVAVQASGAVANGSIKAGGLQRAVHRGKEDGQGRALLKVVRCRRRGINNA